MPSYQFEATAHIPTPPLKHSPTQRASSSAAPFSSIASTVSNASSTSTAASPLSSFAASFAPTSPASHPLTAAALDSPTTSTRVLVTGRLSPTKDKRSSSPSKSSTQHSVSSSSSSSRTAASLSARSSAPEDLDSVAALDELWNAYQHEKSRAASYHTALETLTHKHTQLQSSHSAALSTLDTLRQQSKQHASTSQQLNQTIQELRDDKRALKEKHSAYRSDVYAQIEQLKRDFIATQSNYEATLQFYQQGGSEKQRELDRMRSKLAAYKRQMDGDENGGAAANRARGEAKQATKADEEEKQGVSDDGEGVFDFQAEVEIRKGSGEPIDSAIKRLTLARDSAGQVKEHVGKRRQASLADESCDECEQVI